MTYDKNLPSDIGAHNDPGRDPDPHEIDYIIRIDGEIDEEFAEENKSDAEQHYENCCEDYTNELEIELVERTHWLANGEVVDTDEEILKTNV